MKISITNIEASDTFVEGKVSIECYGVSYSTEFAMYSDRPLQGEDLARAHGAFRQVALEKLVAELAFMGESFKANKKLQDALTMLPKHPATWQNNFVEPARPGVEAPADQSPQVSSSPSLPEEKIQEIAEEVKKEVSESEETGEKTKRKRRTKEEIAADKAAAEAAKATDSKSEEVRSESRSTTDETDESQPYQRGNTKFTSVLSTYLDGKYPDWRDGSKYAGLGARLSKDLSDQEVPCLDKKGKPLDSFFAKVDELIAPLMGLNAAQEL